MLSTFPNLLPFLLFAFVASVTPGPNNILVLSNSARHGLMAALPIILGAGAGAALIVLLVGSGVGQSLSDLPRVHRVMQWLGIAWLSLLAWQIFNAPVSGLETGAHEPRRLGLLSAASLQLINPEGVDDGPGSGRRVRRQRCRTPGSHHFAVSGFLPGLTAVHGPLGHPRRRIGSAAALATGAAALQSLHGAAAVGVGVAECSGMKKSVLA